MIDLSQVNIKMAIYALMIFNSVLYLKNLFDMDMWKDYACRWNLDGDWDIN